MAFFTARSLRSSHREYERKREMGREKEKAVPPTNGQRKSIAIGLTNYLLANEKNMLPRRDRYHGDVSFAPINHQ